MGKFPERREKAERRSETGFCKSRSPEKRLYYFFTNSFRISWRF
ncbi:hypothetical protein LEP1GSC061_2549 [Leptospira wolffii serovar Khorat str. Khorat-H2]|nr:hypothetical protein LEP1GSC061_2549 [Leptospira wolffii serovar Khorat str. Khorat-H2]